MIDADGHLTGRSSTFNPTGLVAVPPGIQYSCEHGISPKEALAQGMPNEVGGTTFIRSKYLVVAGHCPVCRKEERPDDLTTSRVR